MDDSSVAGNLENEKIMETEIKFDDFYILEYSEKYLSALP